MLKKLYDILKKIFFIMNSTQKKFFALVLLCALLAAALETIGVSAIIPLVNALLEPEKLWDKEYVLLLANTFSISSTDSLTAFIIIAVIFLYLIKNAYFILNAWIKVKYSCKVQREISIEVMKSYMDRGYPFFLNHNYSELYCGVHSDVSTLYNAVLFLINAISQLSIVIFISAYMCYSDIQLALGVIMASGICLAIIYFVFRERMVAAGKKYRSYAIRADKILQEAVYGIKDILVMRKQEYYTRQYEKNVIHRQNAEAARTVGGEIPAYIIEGITITGIMLILNFRIHGMDNPKEFVAVLAAFAVGAFRILPAIGKISVAINSIFGALPGVDSVYKNISEVREYGNHKTNNKIEDNYLGLQFEDRIEIDNVSFSYSDESVNVLENLSISIKKGTSVALIGESGAGKSTLADILLGVLKPNKGKVCVDGIDISDIPDKYGEMLGFVPQSIYLSDTSIRNNVAFGVDERDIDDNKVISCLNKANVLDFINTLPSGINTLVGDRGIRLSGGQRQRIGIARALYLNPEILILDEATSALDNDTEKAVMEAIEALKGTITMVIIAHRLSTIKSCDYIYEIVGGNAFERKYDDVII